MDPQLKQARDMTFGNTTAIATEERPISQYFPEVSTPEQINTKIVITEDGDVRLEPKEMKTQEDFEAYMCNYYNL